MQTIYERELLMTHSGEMAHIDEEVEREVTSKILRAEEFVDGKWVQIDICSNDFTGVLASIRAEGRSIRIRNQG